MENLVPD
jgi:hypothetical protein